jgi:hypothetical protein
MNSVDHAGRTGAWFVKLFISHNSVDESLVEALVQLIRAAIPGLISEDIRCTSLDGYRFGPGTKFEDALRQESFSADAFVAVMTSASVHSTYVLLELGARWASGKPLMIVKGFGLDQRLLDGPLSTLQVTDGSSRAEMSDLVDAVAKVVHQPLDRAAAYARAMDKFIVASSKTVESEGVPASDLSGVASIISPVSQERVLQRTMVTWKSTIFMPDVRPWLVVEVGDGTLFPQTPITRRIGTWSNEIRIGRVGRGLDAGTEYTILLVVVGAETDYQYARYIRGQHEHKDGMGGARSSDLVVLDARRVVRGAE